MMDASDRVDATLPEQIDFVPCTHVTVREKDVSGEQDVPQLAKHPQFAVPLA